MARRLREHLPKIPVSTSAGVWPERREFERALITIMNAYVQPLVDTYLGVTLIYVSAYLPLTLWLMRSVFDSLPIALEEAARIDGAGRLHVFFFIVLPLVGPGLTAAAILAFIGAWGQYLVPLVYSPTATKPLTVLIPEFVTKNFID